MLAGMTHTLEQQDRWRRAAPRWRVHQGFVRALTAPASEALLAAAKPAPGETWLDVAAGVGDPAVSLVDRVAPSGRVVMTDLVPDMLRAARDNVRAKVGDRSGGLLPVAAAAEALPANGVFDGVTCRFGAMFFGDPPVALSEIRRSLAPGGRAAFVVWADREQNPYFTEIDGALRDVIPDLPVHEPDEPHVFRYSPSGKLAALMETTGWVNVDELETPFTMSVAISASELWDHTVGLSVEVAGLVEELGADRAAELKSIFERRVARYFPDGTMCMPAVARLVLARAPD
jgi:SAM-dependent methyltransferase